MLCPENLPPQMGDGQQPCREHPGTGFAAAGPMLESATGMVSRRRCERWGRMETMAGEGRPQNLGSVDTDS